MLKRSFFDIDVIWGVLGGQTLPLRLRIWADPPPLPLLEIFRAGYPLTPNCKNDLTNFYITKTCYTSLECLKSLDSKNENFLFFLYQMFVNFWKKKIETQKWCFAEKFRPQKLGVTKGFFILKVVSDFDFDHFLEN